jgi:hypothetical protein
MPQRPRPIGSTPTPRDPKTEETRNGTTKGNPFGNKYGSKGGKQR